MAMKEFMHGYRRLSGAVDKVAWHTNSGEPSAIPQGAEDAENFDK
jgi:hypothetical protein